MTDEEIFQDIVCLDIEKGGCDYCLLFFIFILFYYFLDYL